MKSEDFTIIKTSTKPNCSNLMLSIIIPAYNEAENMVDAVQLITSGIPESVSDYEIIIINDGSSDNTSKIIRDLTAENQKVLGVYHETNQGKGAALQSGFNKARMEWILFTDADLQINISELPLFLEQTDNHDIIIGYRQGRRDPFSRIFSSAIFAAIVRIYFGFKVHDLNCPFKLIRNTFLRSCDLKSKGFFIDTELMYSAFKSKVRIKELAVACQPRQKGVSTVKFKHVIETVRELFELLGRR